ncbi:MAG TPA: alginate export family protein [Thermodesulfovibrionales bacterium]|nr:alginate export family protein [Thermodesulfovibrionales bacterium]
MRSIVMLMLLIALIAGGSTASLAESPEGEKGTTYATSPPEEKSGSSGSDKQIPEQVTSEHWSCKEIAELGGKYGAKKKLPDTVVIEGKSLSRSELAQYLLSVLDVVVAKCDKEGVEAIPREDLDRLAALHEALKAELVQYEGYTTTRETIEKILAKPEIIPFEYKIGAKGFLRGEGAGNFRLSTLSYAPNQSEGRFIYRIIPYAYWDPTDYLDIRLEGQGYGIHGGGQDSDKFALYQGFVEGKLPGSDLLALKVGRQEFVYGSAFIQGADTFFDGLSFDALRLRVQPVAPLTFDLLGGTYATPFSGGLEGYLAGVYATYTFSEGNAAEAYMFQDNGSPEHHAGQHLSIWGLRGTAKLGPVSVEVEPDYESGQLFNKTTGSNDNINAYGGHVDLTYGTTIGGYNNKFFLSYAVGSGGRDAADGVKFNREFRNPNNDSPLMGDMHVMSDLSGINVADHHASGLQIYTLGWAIDITRELNFSATGHYVVANKVEANFSRHIGLETDFSLTYTISDNFSFILAYDHFFTGQFFFDASGSSGGINYGYAMFQFNLAKTKLKAPKA